MNQNPRYIFFEIIKYSYLDFNPGDLLPRHSERITAHVYPVHGDQKLLLANQDAQQEVGVSSREGELHRGRFFLDSPMSV